MGPSRRPFLNLIVDDRIPGARSLRCHQFFYQTTPPRSPNGDGSVEGPPQDAASWAPAADAGNHKDQQAAGASVKMKRIRLPSPILSFHASAARYTCGINCFPVAGRRKVLCADQSGRSFLFDADTRQVETMPDLQALWPMCEPFSTFVPSAGTDDGRDDGDGSLFIMEARFDEQLSGQLSRQFHAFVYCRHTATSFANSWRHCLLPPPPLVCDPKHRGEFHRITSCAVVGSQICVSVEDAGTYCLDTVPVGHTWSHIGEWTLPFHGKVEYVPELKLWFGLSGKDRHLAAADLSAMDSQPQVVGAWNELEQPEKWQDDIMNPQLVNLGSGRFCVARFFYACTGTTIVHFDLEPVLEHFAVLTGVEVMPRRVVGDNSGSGDDTANSDGGNATTMELEMIKHKSRRHTSGGSGGTITTVF